VHETRSAQRTIDIAQLFFASRGDVQLYGGVFAIAALTLGSVAMSSVACLARVSITRAVKPTPVSPITLIG
jgi:hypothetical protein